MSSIRFFIGFVICLILLLANAVIIFLAFPPPITLLFPSPNQYRVSSP